MRPTPWQRYGWHVLLQFPLVEYADNSLQSGQIAWGGLAAAHLLCHKLADWSWITIIPDKCQPMPLLGLNQAEQNRASSCLPGMLCSELVSADRCQGELSQWVHFKRNWFMGMIGEAPAGRRLVPKELQTCLKPVEPQLRCCSPWSQQAVYTPFMPRLHCP